MSLCPFQFLVSEAQQAAEAHQVAMHGLAGVLPWTASIRMAGKTTFILAGWTGMNVAV
jgi:hypothetical protein